MIEMKYSNEFNLSNQGQIALKRCYCVTSWREKIATFHIKG